MNIDMGTVLIIFKRGVSLDNGLSKLAQFTGFKNVANVLTNLRTVIVSIDEAHADAYLASVRKLDCVKAASFNGTMKAIIKGK